MHRRAVTVLLVFLAAAVVAPSAHSDPRSITTCDGASVRNAIAEGGEWVFACDGRIGLQDGTEGTNPILPLALGIPVTKDVTLDANGHDVTLAPGATKYTGYARLLDIRSGTVTLRGVDLADGGNGLWPGDYGKQGVDRLEQTPPPAPNGGPGVKGPSGTDSTPGSTTAVGGGCVKVAPGAGLVLRDLTVSKCKVNAPAGFHGGEASGGGGSSGKRGADGCLGDLVPAQCASNPNGGAGEPGGAAGPGGDGGDGADASKGTEAFGGAIASEGRLDIAGVTFADNAAVGGNGRQGGFAGRGGFSTGSGGGNGGRSSTARGGDGGDGGPGGLPGTGGHGGDGSDGSSAQGGAIWAAGNVSIRDTRFLRNLARGGDGGGGHSGGGGGLGQGGPGGIGGNGKTTTDRGQNGADATTAKTPGNGGAGGRNGKGGDATGGAAFLAGNQPKPVNVVNEGNQAVAGAGITSCDPRVTGLCGHGGAGLNGGADGASAPLTPNGTGAGPDLASIKEDVAPFSTRVNEGDEGATMVDVEIRLNQARDEVSSVYYETRDGTATTTDQGDLDYLPTTGFATFQAGEKVMHVQVQVNGDKVTEKDQTLSVALTAPDAVPLVQKEIGITIVNDDDAPHVVVGDAKRAWPDGAGAEPVEVPVVLDHGTDETVTATLKTLDGTAKAGAEYTAAEPTVTFAPRRVASTAKVDILPDAKGDQLADKVFDVAVKEAANADKGRTGRVTLLAKRPLEVTLKPKPAKLHIEHTAKGPIPKRVTVTVEVENVGKKPVTGVRVPKKLLWDWDASARRKGQPDVPLSQLEAPAKLKLGTIAPGAKKTAKYRLKVRGDLDANLAAAVTGTVGSASTATLGLKRWQVGSDLLVFDSQVGARVRSEKSPKLIKAGTRFLVDVDVENRSNYRRLVIDPMYADLKGNASGGGVSLKPSRGQATGSIDEVRPSPYLVIEPGKKRTVQAVVGTSASDAFGDNGDGHGGGGTRAIVGFDEPGIHTVDNTDKVTDQSKQYVVMKKGAGKHDVSIDDSARPYDFDGAIASLYVTKGIIQGLWNVTAGAVRGVVWDLPKAALTGSAAVLGRSLYFIDREAELWSAVKDDPVLRQQFLDTAKGTAVYAFTEAPFMIPGKIADVYHEADAAVLSKYTKMNNEWYAGDWRRAGQELGTEGTERLADIVTAVAPGVLARMPAVAKKWEVVKAATYLRASEAMTLTLARNPTALQALNTLSGIVRPGLEFSNAQLRKLYGLAEEEAAWLRDFADRNNVLITLRSRATSSIEWIKKGAKLKPAWIKLKSVNRTDARYLGYLESDVGRLVVRPPRSKSEVIRALVADGLKQGDTEYQAVLQRLAQREKEFNGAERRAMQKWSGDGKVEGTWPWQENGVDPSVALDELSEVGFKLIPSGRPGEYIPSILDTATGQYVPITGDIDLIGLTHKTGMALSDAEHVRLLTEIRNGPIGASHPESATWIKDGLFYFKAKMDYLRNDGVCCLAQIGADGLARAVQFDERFSRITNRAKHNYRLWFTGGYQGG